MFSIAKYTIIENYRNKVFISAIGLILLMCGMAWFGSCININNSRFYLSFFPFGMNLTEILIIAVALFLPAAHLAMEFEKGTANVLWAKLKDQSEYFLGKYLAFLVMIVSISVIAALCLGIVALINGVGLRHICFLGYYILAQFLQGACVLSMLFFLYSVFRNAVLSSLLSLLVIYFSIFLDVARDLSHTSQNMVIKIFYSIIYYAMPQLSSFNFEHQIVYQENISLSYLAVVLLYALVYSTVLIALSNIFFSRKEV